MFDSFPLPLTRAVASFGATSPRTGEGKRGPQ